MILTHDAIQGYLKSGLISIEPFDPDQLREASYDVRLGSTILELRPESDPSPGMLISGDRVPVIDVAKPTPTYIREIPEKGMILYPWHLYLASTIEVVASHQHACVFDGKSSLGRLGISVHQCAGFIDPGFIGQVTLEITVIHPTRVYAGMAIGQLRWHAIEGEVKPYGGADSHYQGQRGPTPSLSHLQIEAYRKAGKVK
jgi:dCTP deaminase